MSRSWFSLFAIVAALGLPIGVRGETPPLLEAAVQKLIQQSDEWAFTEVIRRTDRDEGETVARFDPSRPEGERWELVLLKGRAPTASETKQWLTRGRRDHARSDECSLFELMDLEQSRVVADTGDVVRYEVPFKKEMVGRIPTDPFVVYLTLNKANGSLEHASLKTRSAFRVGGVAQIDSVEGEVIFKQIDGSGVSRPCLVRATRTGHLLFVRLDGSAEVVYKDQRHIADH